MLRRPITLAVVLAAQLAAAAAFGQEYSRSSGGELQLFRKQSLPFSGTLFGDTRRGYGATVGGTLLPDRLWFFGSMERQNVAPASASLFTRPAEAGRTTSGKIDANLGDRQSVQAIAMRSQVATTPALTLVPESFLSLHYTGIISPNAFFTARVSQSVAHP